MNKISLPLERHDLQKRLKNYKHLKNLLLFIGVGLISAICALALGSSAQLQKVENIFYDLRVKGLNKSANINPLIKQIVIDQTSLEWMSKENSLSWPWPREIYAHIISFLKEGDAKAVVFDMIFTEPSVYGMDDDAAFASGLKSMQTFGAIVLRNNGDILRSIPEIDGAFSAKGSVNAHIDNDGVIRKVLLLTPSPSGEIPTLSLSLYESLYGKRQHIETKPEIINFRGDEFSFYSYNAAEILASKIALDEGGTPTVNPKIFKDSVVFIGLSAPGLHDLKPTPIGADFPGVEIHSTIYDNLLQDDFIQESSLGALIGWTLLLALVTALLTYKIDKMLILSISYSLLPLLVLTLTLYYHKEGVWLYGVVILVAVLLSLLLSSILKYFLEGRQKSYIKGAFGKYISPEVVEELIKNPDMLTLGGEERELSIFFSDIAGFTTISEKLPPKELVAMLNTYLDTLSKVILSSNGTIDKYEGDAIIAFWNAPSLQENHASLALKAALECQERVKELNKRFGAELGIKLNTRIGINTGKVIVGNIGSSLRFDYSFIGDAGNFAARLEGANKFFATNILISEFTANKTDGGLGLREVGKIKVVGKTESVRVFEPCFYLEDSQKEEFRNALYMLYKTDIESANTIFEKLSEIDPVSLRYTEIVEDIKRGDIVWDDGLILTSK